MIDTADALMMNMIETNEAPAAHLAGWSMADWLQTQREPITKYIHQALMDMLYEHRSYLRLAQVRQLAPVEVDHLLRYAVEEDINTLQAHARARAEEGMASASLLVILKNLSRYCCQHLSGDALVKAITWLSEYGSYYLDYFVEAREQIILAEQEHIRSALQGSFNRYYTWLQTAAEVSRSVTSTLDLRQLITQAVGLIREHFDHHHVALYLLDSSRKYAVLRASSSRSGQMIPREGQKVRVDTQTLVGKCALSGEPHSVASTKADALRSDKTLLTETQSVMLLPLKSRRRVIGVILIQSTNQSAFYDDDITRLQTVADQLANAIENARLYNELQIHSQNLAQAVELRTLELEKTTERVEAILDNSPDAILLLSPSLHVELGNPAAYDMFGFEPDSLIGTPLDRLIVPECANAIAQLQTISAQEGRARSFDLIARRCNDTVFDAGFALAVIREDDTVTGYVCIIRDITEQVQAEDQIKASLREKEVLLQEIHHRVKNNMQVISSLIALQAGYTDDTRVHQMFRESQTRIRSMALVHEQLYRSHDLARIDFARYIRELTSNLMHSYQHMLGRIQLEVEADPIFLDIDNAIPCGLIVNELVSNALKHAFPNDREGRITVEFRRSADKSLVLIVRDNGVGFPEHLNVHKTDTLGLQLVTSLTAQLNATIGLLQNEGTSFEIRFPLPKNQGETHLRGKTQPLISG